jgi:type II secretory pathway pseudopilin PulG
MPETASTAQAADAPPPLWLTALKNRPVTVWMVVVGMVLFGTLAVPWIWGPSQSQREQAALFAAGQIMQAQMRYHEKDWNGDGVLEYAASLSELVKEGLLPKKFAAAEGDPGTAAEPLDGYVFKILKAQDNGLFTTSYQDSQGRMTIGFAVSGLPDLWNETGRMAILGGYPAQNGSLFTRLMSAPEAHPEVYAPPRPAAE